VEEKAIDCVVWLLFIYALNTYSAMMESELSMGEISDEVIKLEILKWKKIKYKISDNSRENLVMQQRSLKWQECPTWNNLERRDPQRSPRCGWTKTRSIHTKQRPRRRGPQGFPASAVTLKKISTTVQTLHHTLSLRAIPTVQNGSKASKSHHRVPLHVKPPQVGPHIRPHSIMNQRPRSLITSFYKNPSPFSTTLTSLTRESASVPLPSLRHYQPAFLIFISPFQRGPKRLRYIHDNNHNASAKLLHADSQLLHPQSQPQGPASRARNPSPDPADALSHAVGVVDFAVTGWRFPEQNDAGAVGDGSLRALQNGVVRLRSVFVLRVRRSGDCVRRRRREWRRRMGQSWRRRVGVLGFE